MKKKAKFFIKNTEQSNSLTIRVKRKRKRFDPVQQEALTFMESNPYGNLLGLDTRLGKTKVVCRFIKNLLRRSKLRYPTLVVCPSEVVGGWIGEMQSEGVYDVRSIASLTKVKRTKLLSKQHQVYVTNKESVLSSMLALHTWSCIVVDESHVLVNIQSSSFAKHMSGKTCEYRGRKIKGMQRARYSIAVNGNPFSEGVVTVVNQIIWSHGIFMGCRDWWSFRRKYMTQCSWSEHQWDLKKGVEDRIRAEAHRVGFIALRKTGEKKVYSRITLTMPARVRKQYRLMEKDFEADGLETDYAMSKHLYMYRLAQGHIITPDAPVTHRWLGKIRACMHLIQGRFKGRQVIVWCRFICDIKALASALDDEGITNACWAGFVPKKKKPIQKKSFDRGDIQVAILQFKANYRGTRYTNAYASIYLNNEFSGDMRSQSEDRPIDARVEGTKFIVDVTVKDSIDEVVTNLSRNKTMNGKRFMKELRRIVK